MMSLSHRCLKIPIRGLMQTRISLFCLQLCVLRDVGDARHELVEEARHIDVERGSHRLVRVVER